MKSSTSARTARIPPTTRCGLFRLRRRSSEVKRSLGIVLGGSGNGEAIAANKVKGVRCGLCWNDETAELSRQHNNANVLSLGQRMISIEIALRIVDIWLNSTFEGGRHAGRIEQLARYEAGQPMR